MGNGSGERDQHHLRHEQEGGVAQSQADVGINDRSGEHKKPSVEADEGDESEDEWFVGTGTQHGKRKKKKKKRAVKSGGKEGGKEKSVRDDTHTEKRPNISETRHTPHESHVKKKLRWGRVTLQTFERAASCDSVPASGAWPLGFAKEPQQTIETTVDAYENLKQEDIGRRVAELPKRLRKAVTGETRQYDYKLKEKNPLFWPLDEMTRKMALLRAVSHMQDANLVAMEEEQEGRCTELDGIRQSRRSVGCSCHTSKAPEKLGLKKLKEELHRRHISATGTDKHKLVELLRDAMRNEQLCGTDECECFRAGVPCHGDVCGCCVVRKTGCCKGCMNPKGSQLYKEATVRDYRSQRLVDAPREQAVATV